MGYSKDLREAAVKYKIEKGHTLEETAEVFGVGKVLKRNDITLKKKTIRYKEQDPEKVKKYTEKIAYVDETGIDTCLFREYGYAPRGEKIYAKITGRKFKRTNIVAARLGKKIRLFAENSG